MLIADLPRSYPSSRAKTTLVMTDTWPSAPSQGFLNFPIKKYLGGDSVSGKAVHVWHYFSKSVFSQNDLLDLDSLVQIKNRNKQKGSPNCRAKPTGASTVSGDSAGDFRELDSNS